MEIYRRSGASLQWWPHDDHVPVAASPLREKYFCWGILTIITLV